MARIKWLPGAIKDFERLYFFLLDKDAQAANKAASNIIDGSDLLKTSPRIGRPMSDNGDRRELFIAFGAGAYVIRNKLETKDIIVITRIWHNREYRD
jgi:plasmid stabilization system protein ParE